MFLPREYICTQSQWGKAAMKPLSIIVSISTGFMFCMISVGGCRRGDRIKHLYLFFYKLPNITLHLYYISRVQVSKSNFTNIIYFLSILSWLERNGSKCYIPTVTHKQLLMMIGLSSRTAKSCYVTLVSGYIPGDVKCSVGRSSDGFVTLCMYLSEFI